MRHNWTSALLCFNVASFIGRPAPPFVGLPTKRTLG
jgi:hypothetical protein